MAVFQNIDESRTHLVKAHGSYHLLRKKLKQGKTREEVAYLRRTPQIEEFYQEGYIRRANKRYCHFHHGLEFVDFSKFHPVEGPLMVKCPAGRYRLDCLTIIANGNMANLVVLERTTIGLALAGVECIMARQYKTQDQNWKRNRVVKIIATHFGLEKRDLDDSFILPDAHNLGTRVGSGPYYAFSPFPNQKPILIRNGVSLKEILLQIN